MRAAPTDLPVSYDLPGLTSRSTNWGELDVAVETYTGAPRDATEAFRSLPDGRCRCPHWGYLVKGRMRIKYADGEEVISAGDIWYMPPGHIPVLEEDGVNIVFSPAGEYQKVLAALGRRYR